MQLVRFSGASGEPLTGWMHPAAGSPWGALLLAHCFTCSKDLPLYRRLAEGLSAQGLGLLRFDFTGIGQSGGDFARTTLETNVMDLRLAFAELRRRTAGLPLGLVGHSLGGSATLLAAEALPEAQAVALIATPADPADLERQLGTRVRAEAEAGGAAEVTIGGRPVRIGLGLLDSLRGTGLPGRVRELRRPLLLVHGTDDGVVSVAQSEALFAAASQPKGFAPVDGGDHLLGRAEDAGLVVELLALWFRRQLHRGAAPPRR